MRINIDNILDELLVLKSQNHDMEAFSLLVKRFQPVLLRHAFRMTRDNEAASDIAQESWYAIAKGIARLKSPGAFRAWALKIAGNKSANWIKQEQRKRKLSVDSEMFLDTETIDSESEPIAIIKLAMMSLSVKNKTILSMFYVDNYSVKEIAESLSISTGTVKSRLFYARKTLKEKFEDAKTKRI